MGLKLFEILAVLGTGVGFAGVGLGVGVGIGADQPSCEMKIKMKTRRFGAFKVFLGCPYGLKLFDILAVLGVGAGKA